jgi:hypothetical protein
MNDETTTHVLQCRETEALAIWHRSITDLERWMISNLGHPELCELIILALQKWHNQERFPLTYDILEPQLKDAWTKQRRLGWTSFIEGYRAKEWRLCQHNYLHQIKSQRSSLLWTSRVQRKIWLIAWDMWEHRNNFLHNDGKTMHSIEMTALNEEIGLEWNTGIEQLPPKYAYLFHGTLQQRLEDKIKHKLMWIYSLWAARDNELHIGPQRTRNPDMVNLFARWKAKNSIDD